MLKEIAQKVNEVLSRLQIDYFVMGRVAVACWGIPAATLNIDIVISIEKEDIKNFLLEMEKIGLKFDFDKTLCKLEEGRPAKLWYKEGISVGVRVASFTIDYEALDGAKEVEIWGKKWKICPPEELIVYKLAAEKPKDIEDIKGILMNKNLNLNWEKINQLCKTLDEEYEKNFLKKFEKLLKIKEELEHS